MYISVILHTKCVMLENQSEKEIKNSFQSSSTEQYRWCVYPAFHLLLSMEMPV